MIIRNTSAFITHEYLDNIKLSICAMGMLTHLTRWTNNGLHTEEILDQVYDMSHHDQYAAIGYVELVENRVINNFFPEDELETIKSLTQR